MSTATEISPDEIVRQIQPNRQLSSTGSLTTKGVRQLLYQLNLLQEQEGDILWKVDSNGGGFDISILLYRAFLKSRNRIIGLVTGEASSGAFIALQGCGLRFAEHGAQLQVHNPLIINYEEPIRSSTNEADYLKAQQEWFRSFHPLAIENREVVIRIVHGRGNLASRKAAEAFIDAEDILTPEKAIELGFLDAVIPVDR